MPYYPTISQTITNALSSTTVAFTDGDVSRRVTITDATVASTSKIVLSVRKPDSTDDSVDKGHFYDAQVVKIATGTFDIVVTCHDGGYKDVASDPPNETITIYYIVAA